MTDGNSKDTEWETPGISFNNRKEATCKNVNQTSDFVSWPGFQKLLRCIETTNNILKNQKLSYKLCYGLNICDLQIFIYWSMFNPIQSDGVRRGAFGRWLGWGWSPRDGISALIRWDIRALPLSLILSLHLTPTTWGYKESLAIYGPGTELSPESDKAGTLISDLQPLESWETHSVQFSCSLVSDSLLPHESQHARPPCPSPASGVHPNSCASSQWCHPAISSSVIPFSSCPQWINCSHEVAKVLEFRLQHQSFNEHPRLVSFRMDWLDLLEIQGTLKSFLQHHSSKASIFRCSAFFTVQLSHPYMIAGKTITLTRWTFVGKVMSLLLNMLSRLVITYFPRSKSLLISWLQSSSAVILDPRKIKSATVSTVSPSISHEVMRLDAMIFVFWMLSFKSAFFTPLFYPHQETL